MKDTLSEYFQVGKETRQGCVLYQFFFNIKLVAGNFHIFAMQMTLILKSEDELIEEVWEIVENAL